jgi:hypothetical protein
VINEKRTEADPAGVRTLRGLSLDEGGIDEFARRKGHRYDTILCDLDGRHVLEVSAGR